MTGQPSPRIRRTAQNTQFTYNLSTRIHDVQTYPVLSPQGATVLIYGHDNGVTLMWRGGRRFKEAPKKPAAAATKERRNGANDDAVMILDSDDDQPPAKAKTAAAFVDNPRFVDAADDGPYPEITQTLELYLGTPAFHVAVLPMTPCAADDASVDLLGDKMAFAVSCATNEIFVVTAPLTPPSPESKARPELRADLLGGRAGAGLFGESVTVLGGQTKHAGGLAMSLVKPKASPTSGRTKDPAGSVMPPGARVVVAAHTREASGVLRLWDVTLDGRPGTAEGVVAPFQTEYLPSPLSRIAFNPARPTQLLAVSSPHATRIYDYAAPSIPDDDPSTGPFPSQGSWQLSLYQPFVRPTATRKPILDAAWIAHGRAVLALFADGMWGIWDLDGASPHGATLLGKNSSGIRGAAMTDFSAKGYIEGISPLRGVPASQTKSSRGSGGGGGGVVGLEPMTPHSRRDAAASLTSAATPERLAAVHGGISIVGLPATGAPSGTDESAVLWIGGLDHVCVVPGVSRFWDAQLRRGAGGGVNLFSGAQPTRMLRLHDLSTGLLGERCCGVGAIVNLDKARKDAASAGTGGGGGGNDGGGLPIEVLVRGESRLVVVRDAEDGPGARIGGVVSTKRRLLGARGSSAGGGSDAALGLHRGASERPSSRFDLSVNRAGSLRARPAGPGDSEEPRELTLPSRPRSGFSFEETMSRAADAPDDDFAVGERDLEVEMLDIMEIDRALEELEDERGSGRKRVNFE